MLNTVPASTSSSPELRSNDKSKLRVHPAHAPIARSTPNQGGQPFRGTSGSVMRRSNAADINCSGTAPTAAHPPSSPSRRARSGKPWWKRIPKASRSPQCHRLLPISNTCLQCWGVNVRCLLPKVLPPPPEAGECHIPALNHQNAYPGR